MDPTKTLVGPRGRLELLYSYFNISTTGIFAGTPHGEPFTESRAMAQEKPGSVELLGRNPGVAGGLVLPGHPEF